MNLIDYIKINVQEYLKKQRNHARTGKNIFRFVVDSWFSFQAYCQNHCSILIENFSSRDASAISYFIQSQLRGENFWKVTCDRTMFSNKITWALIHSRKKMQIKKKTIIQTIEHQSTICLTIVFVTFCFCFLSSVVFFCYLATVGIISLQ